MHSMVKGRQWGERLPPGWVGYCGWNNRSGPYIMPDHQPCDLVSQRYIEHMVESLYTYPAMTSIAGVLHSMHGSSGSPASMDSGY